jgi:hypothetical protein
LIRGLSGSACRSAFAREVALVGFLDFRFFRLCIGFPGFRFRYDIFALDDWRANLTVVSIRWAVASL